MSDKLRRYLEENQLSLSAFARKAGMSPSGISRIISGERTEHGASTIAKIRKATGGRVDLAAQ